MSKYLLGWVFWAICLAASLWAQAVRRVSPAELQQAIAQRRDSVLVVNFWATWCKPCVAELPAFEQLRQHYKARGLALLLVSLDDPASQKSVLEPFVRKRGLQSPVLLMTEPNPNRWIDSFEPAWSGALPATLVYARGGAKQRFFSDAIVYDTLATAVENLLPPRLK